MRVYLAARYSRKLELREYAKQAEENGIVVGAEWLKESESPTSTLEESTPETLTKYALQDISDIIDCDAFVFFSESSTEAFVRGGRHVEFGFALALEKPIIIIGKEENIFHYLPFNIEFFDTWESALVYLTKRNAN